jgi:hypothetical protein
MPVKQLFFTSLLFLLISCNSSYEPKRVKGIPLTAFWKGGPDGGNWFIIEKADTTTKRIHFKIYHDVTGELLIDKDFILDCDAIKPIDWGNIKNLVTSFDGKKIYFQPTNKEGKYCYFE